MPTTILEDLPIADGQILSLRTRGGALVVEFQNYQEEIALLTFEDCYAFEAFGFEGEEISHLESPCSEFLTLTEERIGEMEPGLNSYAFVSAWSSRPVVRVVAKAVVVSAHAAVGHTDD